MQVIENIKLSDYSIPQKINLMERLWDDLSWDEEKIKSPPWHETELKKREKELKEGKIKLSNWEESKIKIRKKVYADNYS